MVWKPEKLIIMMLITVLKCLVNSKLPVRFKWLIAYYMKHKQIPSSMKLLQNLLLEILLEEGALFYLVIYSPF